MFKSKSVCSNLIINIFLTVLMYSYVLSTPMMYKRNPDDKYERDLVAVSSTVIPLTVLEVSYGNGGKPSEEYKETYIRKLRKKVQHTKSKGEINEDPDTLITIKRKNNDANGRANIKRIITASRSAVSESKD